MARLEVNIINVEQQIVYGVWGNSNDKSISTDIKALSGSYQTNISAQQSVLPYFVLSRNYDEQSGNFELFIGGMIDKDGLERFTIPSGQYAKISVKPKLGFLWGPSIGQAKTYFYTKWLPVSTYQALNMEYEYHTERSIGKHPTIDIIFAIERK